MPAENPEGFHHSFQDEINPWIYEWAFSDFAPTNGEKQLQSLLTNTRIYALSQYLYQTPLELESLYEKTQTAPHNNF